jgi:hypothetical protein
VAEHLLSKLEAKFRSQYCKTKEVLGLAEWLEWRVLPSKDEALGSNHSPTKRKRKKKTKCPYTDKSLCTGPLSRCL